jgi:hypothetical protein
MLDGFIDQYRRIFQSERAPRALEFLIFLALFAFVVAPGTLFVLNIHSTPWWVDGLVGALCGAVGYPAAYRQELGGGLLQITVVEYLQSRLIAIVVGICAPIIIIFGPILFLWAHILPILWLGLALWLIWAVVASSLGGK